MIFGISPPNKMACILIKDTIILYYTDSANILYRSSDIRIPFIRIVQFLSSMSGLIILK